MSGSERHTSKVSFIFFDHGGTLSHTTNEPPEIVAEVLGENGYTFPVEQVLRASQVSEAWWSENQDRLPRGRRKPLLVESHAVLLRNLNVREAKSLAEKIQDEWHVRAGFTLYPETIRCLEDLRKQGIPLGVITQNLDTIEEFRNHALKIEGIGDYFSVIVTSESAGFDKPDPRLFRAAAKLAGLPPQSVLHVGDNLELDVQGAESAGMQAVLINRSENRNQRKVKVISSLSELSKLLV